MFKSVIFLLVAARFAMAFCMNNEPVIGILSQELPPSLESISPGKYASYIAASYVKYLEGSGARVIPVWIGQTNDYYKRIIEETNGILFPGGSAPFNVSGGYAEAAGILYRHAIEMNQNGTYYPVWATCLGMEVLMMWAANGTDIRVNCSAQSVALPLVFKPESASSRLYGNISEDIKEVLTKQNVTANFHIYCIIESDLDKHNISKDYKVLTVNNDVHGFQFVSSIEANDYPIYAVQFHPEKNIYEWVTGKNIPHTEEAIVVGQYYANFFVNECRKNPTRVPSKKMKSMLIYNYPATYSALHNSSFQQVYLFEEMNITSGLLDNSVDI